jgi:hypothetical protein
MGLPIPEIYVHQTVKEDKTHYGIVDGQQRIRTILQFIGADLDPAEQHFNKFSLDKLDASSSWANATYITLDEAERKRFLGHRLAVRYLDTDNEDEIREMFRRLNKYLTPLKAQELRNATYTGPLVRLVVRLADDEYWAENRIVTAESIRRMGDVEFISELVIGLLHGPQGGSSVIIDDYYSQYEDYEDEFPKQRVVQRLFEEAKKTIQELFPTIKASRWGNKTDFYSLFVALGALLRKASISKNRISQLRHSLEQFGNEVDERLANEDLKVSKEAATYVRAVEKGANDKARRADRHEVLLRLMEGFFAVK